MTAPTEYTEDQLNYYRICCVTTDVLAEGLRAILKQEWDNRYKATLGEWKDEPCNGRDFKKRESLRNQTRNARLLATMVNGNRAEWDCTMLFYAILYSDCIGAHLSTAVKSPVDDLRMFRNEDFAHIPQGHLSDLEFQNAIAKVDAAFQALGLSTVRIQELSKQASFPTKELKKVLKEVDDLRQEVKEKEKEIQEKDDVLQQKEDERQALEDQLKNEISPFCVTPPKPSHDVTGRDNKVAAITRQLRELKEANKGRLSYLYISGNPGSGKSQLAALIANRLFEEVSTCESAFVMTLNAESLGSLVESYVSFARRVKCPGYEITNIRDSKELPLEEKIANLKTLVSTKVELYTSWFLVVDNVTSLSQVSVYLPEPGNEQWCRGQIIITTQDSAGIPLTNSFINHISVSKGMSLSDATSLLVSLSGITNSEMVDEVALALDYQPLALASAATFVNQVRKNKTTSNFGWSDYLKKLKKGQRAATETILSGTNPSYRKSMTAAINLAVENAMSSDKVLNHLFTFLSLCAQYPLSLEIATKYIQNADEDFEDEQVIQMRIRRSQLLLFEEDESDVYIRVHQVTRDVIVTETRKCSARQKFESIDKAVKSFDNFIADKLLLESDSALKSRHIVPHLKSMGKEIENTFSGDDIHQFVENLPMFECYPGYFEDFSRICAIHCDFNTAKAFCNEALKLIRVCSVFEEKVARRPYSNLGNIHLALGEFLQAQQCYECTLSILLQTPHTGHLDIATTFNNLGVVCRKKGDLEKAKKFCELALAIQLQKLDPQHLDVAITYNNLGAVCSEKDDLAKAKKFYERALAIQLQKLDPQHLDVALSCNNLGAVCSKKGDLAKAKKFYEHALAIQLQKLNPQHLYVALSCNNLGAVCSKKGDLAKAKEFFEHALAIQLQKLDPQHLDVALSYNNLGAVCSKKGDLEKAKEFFECALAIRLQKLDPQHPDVAVSYNNLGDVCSKKGDLEKAKEFYATTLCAQQSGHLQEFHASAGINPDTCKVVAEVINQNQTVQKEDTVTRLQRSVLAKLETDESNVLTWLNPTVKVPVKEKFVTSIGIKASALEGFTQVSVKGFEVAKRLHDKQAVSGPSNPSTSTCSQDNQGHLQTPGHANATTDSAGTRKRLFPAGTIGVLPRHAKRPKQNEDLCAKCHQTSPYKKKTWSRIWIMCDACSQWYHKECANLKTVPKEDETWVCQGCGKK